MAALANTGATGVNASLVESFGRRIGEAMNWPPMAGRAAGVLMLSDSPLSMPQLQEALEASKGSVSETTRLLIDNGVIERFKEPGQRQFVYRWRSDAWIGCLDHQFRATVQLLDFAESVQEDGRTLPDVQRRRIEQMEEYYRFMTDRLQGLLAEYSELAQSDDSA
ncbi:GbsR/MarR family transcriptional regulator [Brevibacterium sandarakinum]|uniref:GbsR/MarR family transcriptional regulator n=1 Tax=Brevibacterium sandarakinum TaxID=629680 RepID=UPI00265666FA|nr:hypothetical protein [Brevibacterium sandarakinum]MDN5656551.1 hypothetical protein [Brevibacterium sandarakinum]